MRIDLKHALIAVCISQWFDVVGYTIIAQIFAVIALLRLLSAWLTEEDPAPIVELGKPFSTITMHHRDFGGFSSPSIRIYTGNAGVWLRDSKAVPAREVRQLERLWNDEVALRRKIRLVAAPVATTIELLDDLTSWTGGPMPVAAGEAVVVRLRSGAMKECTAGEGYATRWEHTGARDDIVAYRRSRRRK